MSAVKIFLNMMRYENINNTFTLNITSKRCTIYLHFFKIWIFYKRYWIHTKLLSLSQYNRFTRISRYVTLDIKFPVNTNSDKVQTIIASSSINIRHKQLIEYKCVLFNFIDRFLAFVVAFDFRHSSELRYKT